MQTGEEIDLLAMIDSPQNDHSWSFWHWAKLMKRTLVRQARQRLSAKPAPENAPQQRPPTSQFDHSPKRRGHQLLFRFRNPRNPDYPLFAPQWAGGYTPRYDKAARQLLQMKGLFRPQKFDETVMFLHSVGGSPIDCDAKAIWRAYLPRADWIEVAGNHQSMIVGRHGRALAAHLDRRLMNANVRETNVGAPE